MEAPERGQAPGVSSSGEGKGSNLLGRVVVGRGGGHAPDGNRLADGAHEENREDEEHVGMKPGRDSLHVARLPGQDFLPETHPHGDGIPETGQLEEEHRQATDAGNPFSGFPPGSRGNGQAIQIFRLSGEEENRGNVVPGQDGDRRREPGMQA